MDTVLHQPWPWYVAGPVIGLFAPLLLWLGNRLFGFSSNLRHMCAVLAPRSAPYFGHDWRREGGWNLMFAAGTLAGGFVAGWLLANPEPVAISAATRADLAALGVHGLTGLVPMDLFTWESLQSVRGWGVLVLGGFLVGFGTAYAGGCTSGHGISGIANLEPASLVALLAFFAGGIAGTFWVLPWILSW